MLHLVSLVQGNWNPFSCCIYINDKWRIRIWSVPWIAILRGLTESERFSDLVFIPSTLIDFIGRNSQILGHDMSLSFFLSAHLDTNCIAKALLLIQFTGWGHGIHSIPHHSILCHWTDAAPLVPPHLLNHCHVCYCCWYSSCGCSCCCFIIFIIIITTSDCPPCPRSVPN